MKITRVLAPIDFSEQSRAALREADELAAARGADLILLHVHQIVEVAVLDFTYVERPEAVAEVCDAAEAELRRWSEDLQTPPERIKVQVATGSPVVEIVRATKECDIAVLATHGRTGLSHFLMGSVSERVIQGARCSVLVVKQPSAT